MATYDGVEVKFNANAGMATQPGAVSIGRIAKAEDIALLLDNARKGNAEVQVTPSMQAARALVRDGGYRFGFDVAIGVCKGMWLPGPGQDRIRLLMGPFSTYKLPDGSFVKGSNEAMQGYSVGQALQHGISKARNDAALQGVTQAPPAEAAGMLIAAGISGSGAPPDQKAATMQTVTANPSVMQGAQVVVDKKVGFFAKLKAFFGL